MHEPFRSFLPLHNPLGFGLTDFIELVLGALLVILVLFEAGLGNWGRKMARHTRWCMLALAILTAALRLALWPQSPVPTPNGSDEFSHLLAADTLAHGRTANPTHPLHRFFETAFVLQEPTYSSIFPIGQAIVLATGRAIFNSPWAGVLISCAALSALCYWMLLAWTSPGWALTGAILAIIEFGPLRYWMNTYWGGAVSAVAGCLVFGSLPRLRARARTRDAILLGLGIGLQWLTRPFESAMLVAVAIAYFLPALRHTRPWRTIARETAIVAIACLPALGLSLFQNKQVTGNWTTLPYMLSRYQYGVPTTFTFQPSTVPHRDLTPSQRLNYEEQAATHGDQPETLKNYADRLLFRARFYRFFFLAPLYLALPFFLPALRQLRFVWLALALVAFALASNFYPYFYPHYLAAASCLFILVSITGLESLNRLSREAALVLVLLCVAQFFFWYGFHLFADTNAAAAMLQYDAWDDVNHGDPEGRIAVHDQLAHTPGKQLIFVRYGPRHRFQEWIQNAADIDRAAVVWALDRGQADNETLRAYYPDRKAWLLEPDARPPKLAPYQLEPPPVPKVEIQPPKEPREKPSPEMNGIQLLPVQ